MIKPKANTVNDVILSLCSVMAPLIAEYDRHINDMTVQLKKYQVNEEIFQQVTQTYTPTSLYKSCALTYVYMKVDFIIMQKSL